MFKLQKESIQWAIKSMEKNYHICSFPLPFEFKAIQNQKNRVIDYLSEIDLTENGARQYRSMLSPKSPLGFRKTTQLDPLDNIVLNAVLYEISDDMEKTRIDKNEKVVHSFRLLPKQDGTIFDPEYSWNSCLEEAKKKIDNGDFGFVLITDISDFFPSIYLHDIENELEGLAGNKQKLDHAKFLIKYIKTMNDAQTHKGVPVGTHFSWPIAEIILNSIDRYMIEKNITFLRYVDDYFIFCKDKFNAYINLSFLAQKLYEHRNLKLNEQKTRLLDADSFYNEYFMNSAKKSRDSLVESFKSILIQYNLSTNLYDEIDLDLLNKEAFIALSRFDFKSLLAGELDEEKPDNGIVGFSLSASAKFGRKEVLETLMDDSKIEKMVHKLKNIVNYLSKVNSLTNDEKRKVGEKILQITQSNYIGTLPFNLMWLYSLFAESSQWLDGSENLKILLSNRNNDNVVKRELYLSIRQTNDVEFFRSIKYDNYSSDIWLNRSVLYGMSCLPTREFNPWARSLVDKNKGDILMKVVYDWISSKEFVC